MRAKKEEGGGGGEEKKSGAKITDLHFNLGKIVLLVQVEYSKCTLFLLYTFETYWAVLLHFKRKRKIRLPLFVSCHLQPK